MDVKASIIPVKLLSEGHCDEHNIYKGIRCMNCEIWICGMCGVLNHKQCRTLLVKEAYKDIQEQIALSLEKELEERNARTDKINDSLKVLDVKRKELIEELKNCEKQIEELGSLKLKEENLYKNVNLVKEIIESSSTYEEFSNAKKDIDSLREIGNKQISIELQRNQLDSNTKKIAEDSTSRISTEFTDEVVIEDSLEVSVDSGFRAPSIQIKLEDTEHDELMKIEIEECQFGEKKVSNVSNTSNSNPDNVLDEEIIRFLTDNGFLEYIDTFRENHIDFSVLSSITEEQIQNIIPNFGDRIRFCSKLSRYLTEKGVRQSPLYGRRSVSADATTLLDSHDDSMEISSVSSSSSPSLPTYNLTNSEGTFEIGVPVLADATIKPKSLNVLVPEKKEEIGPKKIKDYSYYRVRDQIKNLPLPDFEDKLCHVLRNSAAGTVRNSTHASVVQQTIKYYLHHIPNLKGYGGLYSLISQKMIKEYPSLGTGGAGDENWIGFKGALSSRIRHVRFQERKLEKHNLEDQAYVDEPASKKQRCNEQNEKFNIENCVGFSSNNTAHVESSLTKKKFELQLTDDDIEQKSDEEYNQIMKMLSNNFEKYKVSVNVKQKNITLNFIKVAIKEVYANTKDWLEDVGSLLPIITKHPIYQNGEIWLMLFSIRLNDDDLLNTKASMKRMLSAMKTVMSSKEIPSLLDVMHFVFEKTKITKGNGPKSVSVIEVHKDIPYDNVQKFLKAKEVGPMKIIAFQKGTHDANEFQSIWIVGHGQIITVPDASILSSLLILFATYYMLNVEYPKMYSGQMGIMQTYGFNIGKYTQYKSIGYQKLCPSIERALEKQE